MNDHFKLPEWNFIGGSSQERTFNFVTDEGRIYNFPSCTASFSIVDIAKNSVLTKQITLIADADGNLNATTVTLSPIDTVELFGKYIYQITVKDTSGNVTIPSQGIMNVTDNADKSFTKGGN